MNNHDKIRKRELNRQYHSRPLTAKMEEFGFKSTTGENNVQNIAPKKATHIIVRGYANDACMSISFPTEFAGKRCYPLADYKRKEVQIQIKDDTGDKKDGLLITKGNPGSTTCNVRFTPQWYGEPFTIHQQAVVYENGHMVLEM